MSSKHKAKYRTSYEIIMNFCLQSLMIIDPVVCNIKEGCLMQTQIQENRFCNNLIFKHTTPIFGVKNFQEFIGEQKYKEHYGM